MTALVVILAVLFLLVATVCYRLGKRVTVLEWEIRRINADPGLSAVRTLHATDVVIRSHAA